MPFIILFLYLVIIYVFLFSFYDNNTFDNLELLKEKRKKTKKILKASILSSAVVPALRNYNSLLILSILFLKR